MESRIDCKTKREDKRNDGRRERRRRPIGQRKVLADRNQ